MQVNDTEIAVVGAGIVGLAAAYYLARRHGRTRVTVLDQGAPMALTSAQSGENYRNWWPHPVMTEFTDLSISLMEEISNETGNRIIMTRRGYALATRSAISDALLQQLYTGYAASDRDRIRIHDGSTASAYRAPLGADWQAAPDGVDILAHPALIRAAFPSFAHDVGTILHIRRAGDISGQQLGQYMLEELRAAGGRLVRGRVRGISRSSGFLLDVAGANGDECWRADVLVNAAGPFLGEIAAMLGETLPVHNVFQQKLAFDDVEHAIPRTMPFSIDLDEHLIAWTDDERETLASEPSLAWLTQPIAGGIHCRPDGGDHGSWIKLGWAYNTQASSPFNPAPLDENFPDIVVRAASRLNPSLASYIGRLPRKRTHYGGYYTMTAENWPLIGPMATAGAFVIGALSGFGTMSACAAGSLCADWITGASLPVFGEPLALARYKNGALMHELAQQRSKGVL